MRRGCQNRINSLISAARFGFSLASAFTKPLSHGDAQKLLRRDLSIRAENFLSLCTSEIFNKQASPYRRLLQMAGYSRERLANLVISRGVEGALSHLAADGVYLDIKEFKGQKPVIRPGLRMSFDSTATDISSGPSVPLLSSGSSGPRMTTRISVAGLRLIASNIPIIMEGLHAAGLPVVLYYPMPSVSGVVHLIIFTLGGFPPAAWFSQVHYLSRQRTVPIFQVAALLSAARLNGIRLPFPRTAEISCPATLARWIVRNCPQGAVVPTFPGSALHLLQAASSEGLRLPRLKFILGGEPLTERKFCLIKESGHDVLPWYSSVETGRIALGCFKATSPDDMHVLMDRVAAVTHPGGAAHFSYPSKPVLLTSVHPDSYKFFLNIETGDEAVIENRRCGCLWHEYGLTHHISTVRSYEKLTTEGMTYSSSDVFRLIDEILPVRCGGTAADYQLVEEEDETGLTRLVVAVNPSLTVDEDEVRAAVYSSLQLTSSPRAPMTAILKEASAVVVRRAFPQLTTSGKIMTIRPPAKGKPRA